MLGLLCRHISAHIARHICRRGERLRQLLRRRPAAHRRHRRHRRRSGGLGLQLFGSGLRP